MEDRNNNSNDFIEIFRGGEPEFYDHYFRQYFRPLCYFASQFLHKEEEAEDLVQECFTRLLEKQTNLKNPDTIRSFLYTTVRNGCINVLRKKKVRKHINYSIDESLPEISEASFEDAITKSEMLNEIYHYILQLPPKVGQVCRLYFLEGKNDHEISELLQRSYHTVRNQRQQAIKFLQVKMKAVPKNSKLYNWLCN